MDIINPTPYPHFYYVARNPAGNLFGVCIIRGVYSFTEQGEVSLCAIQDGPVLSSEHYGDPAKTSVRFETDLVPQKPSGEFYLADSSAIAPGRKPSRRWLIAARIGSLKHSIVVTGPRSWVNGPAGGWKLTEPELCSAVDIRYEHAFGGIWEPGTKTEEVFQENPIGVGFIGSSSSNAQDELTAPQIEEESNPIVAPHRRYAPQGFGVISRAWLPRRSLAGTLDQKWKDQRWPLMPDDFSYAYYYSAPVPMRLVNGSYFGGNEQCQFDGFHESKSLAFALPDASDYHLFLQETNNKMKAYRFNLDTVVVQIQSQLLSLVWRAQFDIMPDCKAPFIAPLSAAREHLFRPSVTIT